jgi:hypothetical protein
MKQDHDKRPAQPGQFTTTRATMRPASSVLTVSEGGDRCLETSKRSTVPSYQCVGCRDPPATSSSVRVVHSCLARDQLAIQPQIGMPARETNRTSVR